MPQIKISSQSHAFIERERARLTEVVGRKFTQAEIIERALKALSDRNGREELARRQATAQ